MCETACICYNASKDCSIMKIITTRTSCRRIFIPSIIFNLIWIATISIYQPMTTNGSSRGGGFGKHKNVTFLSTLARPNNTLKHNKCVLITNNITLFFLESWSFLFFFVTSHVMILTKLCWKITAFIRIVKLRPFLLWKNFILWNISSEMRNP